MKTPYDLGLTFDDFKVELIDIKANDIKYDRFTFAPKRYVIVKVNGVTINLFANISMDMIEDLRAFNIRIDDDIILNVIKNDAILKYINSISYVRKEKLKKLNNICI